MGELSAAKADAVAVFARSLPDAALLTLKLGLAEPLGDGSLGPVRRAIEAELNDRRLRDLVLAELRAAAGPGRQFPVPEAASAVVWAAVRSHDPAAVSALGVLLAAREAQALDAAALDLVVAVAAAMEEGLEAFQTAVSHLGVWPGAAERVLRILRLAPLVRAGAPRARAWLKQGGTEEASALRLAVRDASALGGDGGPMLIELLASAFSEPFAALRLVSAVMDRPGEAFLAGSEFAPFALQPLAFADEAVEALRRTGSLCNRAEGVALASLTAAALGGLREVEHAVRLDKDRPWGRRIAAQRRAIAASAEVRLKEADGRVAAALPVSNVRVGLKQVRGEPTLALPLDLACVGRAEASLAFIEGVRRAAEMGGFAALRAKVVEILDARMETYVEDLLEQLHVDGASGGSDRVERLEVAADLWAMVRDPSAAQIVRRRMAAA